MNPVRNLDKQTAPACSAFPAEHRRRISRRMHTGVSWDDMTLSVNLPRVAVEVTRRTLFDRSSFRLLTSAATVQGFNARIVQGNLSMNRIPLTRPADTLSPTG